MLNSDGGGGVKRRDMEDGGAFQAFYSNDPRVRADLSDPTVKLLR